MPQKQTEDGESLGLRLHNPGCIRRSMQFRWRGEVQPNPYDFCRFASDMYGLRALARLLLSYSQELPQFTVAAIITRYAPPSENDTLGYIAYVCHFLGVTDDKRLSYRQYAVSLMRAIINHECGTCPFDTLHLETAVSLALNPIQPVEE